MSDNKIDIFELFKIINPHGYLGEYKINPPGMEDNKSAIMNLKKLKIMGINYDKNLRP